MGFPILSPNEVLASITGDASRPSSHLNKAFWAWLKKKEAAGRPLHEGKKVFPSKNKTLRMVIEAAQKINTTIQLDSDGSLSIFAIPKVIYALAVKVDQ